MARRFATGIDQASPKSASPPMTVESDGAKWIPTHASAMPVMPNVATRRRPKRAPSHPAGREPTRVAKASAMKAVDAWATLTPKRSAACVVNQVESD
jgi:hypothetical protein